MPVGITAGDISIRLPPAPTTWGGSSLHWQCMNVAKRSKGGRGIEHMLLAVLDLCFQQVLELSGLWSAHWGRGVLHWGHGYVGLAARDPEGRDVEKRESCHRFSHPSVPGEAFLVMRNHVTLKL